MPNSNSALIQLAGTLYNNFLRQCIKQNYLIYPDPRKQSMYAFSTKSFTILQNLLKSALCIQNNISSQPICTSADYLPALTANWCNFEFDENDYFNDRGPLFDWNPLINHFHQFIIEKSKGTKITRKVSPYITVTFSRVSTQNKGLDSIVGHCASIRSNKPLTKAQIQHYSTIVTFDRINAWRSVFNNTFTIFPKMNDDYCLHQLNINSKFKASIRTGELPWCPVVERVFHIAPEFDPHVNLFVALSNAPRMLLAVINDMIVSEAKTTNHNSLYTKLGPLKVTLVKTDDTLDTTIVNNIENQLKILSVKYDITVKDIHSESTFNSFDSDFILLLDQIYLENGFIGMIELCSGLMKILRIELLFEYLKNVYR